ncbi:MAG: hypothetical protein WCC48_01455 [Anaeromyxobacteraceae bacterium]
MIWASRVSSARTGAITPLDDVVGHLLHCKRHPAAVLADEALAALAASLGKGGAEALLKLVEERNAQISGLRRLLDSCDRFDDDLGWNGDRAYARGYVEDALDRAQASANAFHEDGEERRAWTAKYLADRWAKLSFLLRPPGPAAGRPLPSAGRTPSRSRSLRWRCRRDGTRREAHA